MGLALLIPCLVTRGSLLSSFARFFDVAPRLHAFAADHASLTRNGQRPGNQGGTGQGHEMASQASIGEPAAVKR